MSRPSLPHGTGSGSGSWPALFNLRTPALSRPLCPGPSVSQVPTSLGAQAFSQHSGLTLDSWEGCGVFTGKEKGSPVLALWYVASMDTFKILKARIFKQS